MSIGRGYIGRTRELDDLSSRMAEARGGAGGLAILSGEGGIGKTRLADEVCGRARDGGALVAWGASVDEAGAPSYWPWIEILRELTRALPDLAAPPEAVALVEGSTRRSDEADEARFLMHDAVARYLVGAASLRPIVVVLDDLHLADRGTLELAVHVSRSLRGRSLFLLAALRPFEAGLDASRAELLARLGRAGVLVPLGPLSGAETHRLVAERTGSAPAPALLDSIMRSTSGNPLLIEGVAHLLAAGAPDAIGAEMPVPHRVRGLLHRRLELVAASRPSLEIAAVIGLEFDRSLVTAARGASPGLVEEELALALRAELLSIRAEGRLAFAHDLFRQALLEQLGGRAVAVHAAVARALLAREPLGGIGAAQIAHHLIAARDPDLAPETARWARRASAQAVGAFDYERAVAIARAALEQCPPERIGDQEHDELTLDLGHALVMASQPGSAREVCGHVLRRARIRADAGLLVRAILLMASHHELLVVHEDLFALLEEGIAATGDADPAARAQLEARLAAAMQPADDPRLPLAMARQAVAQARRFAEPTALLSVLSSAGSAICWAPCAERVAHEEELIGLASRHAAPAAGLRAWARLFVARVEEGDMASADLCIEGYERLALATASTGCLWMPPLMRATRARMVGHLDEATRLLDQAAELAAGIPCHADMTLTFLHLAVDVSAGRRQQALARADALRRDLLARLGDTLWLRTYLALLGAVARVRIGDLAGAQRVEIGASVDHPVIAHDELNCVLYAEVAVALGWTAAARVCYDRLRGTTRVFITHGVYALGSEPPVSYFLGRLARAMGEDRRAVDHLEDALETCRRAGASLHAIETMIELADAVAAADPKRARELRAAALEVADALGLRVLAERARVALGDAGRAGSAPAFELIRDGERWRLACSGRVTVLKDSRGLRMLDRLLGCPDQEIRALDLVDPTERSEAQPGDAGPLLDREALLAYRTRMRDIDGELDASDRNADLGRSGRLRAERAALEDELRRAVGLGGRLRRAASDSERARVNVQRRLKDAIDKIRALEPAVGDHLDRTIRTGAACSYRP